MDQDIEDIQTYNLDDLPFNESQKNNLLELKTLLDKEEILIYNLGDKNTPTKTTSIFRIDDNNEKEVQIVKNIYIILNNHISRLNTLGNEKIDKDTLSVSDYIIYSNKKASLLDNFDFDLFIGKIKEKINNNKEKINKIKGRLEIERLEKEINEKKKKIEEKKKKIEEIEKEIEEIEKKIEITKREREEEIDFEILSKKMNESGGGNKKTKESDKYTVKQLKTLAFVYNVKSTKKSNGKIVNLKSDELLTKLKKSKIIL
jgi:hypothetical protein